MEQYTTPELEIIQFDADDIITTSDPTETPLIWE